MRQRKRAGAPVVPGLVGFLQDFSDAWGPQSLEGAILLLRLKRPIDDLISLVLGLGPYHFGTPSPWSHNVLLAGPFDGNQTRDIPILDCTIRDKDGNVDWDTPISEILKGDLTKQGGIYSGTIGDYDDPRVFRYGVKFIPGLSPKDRAKLVARGKVLQSRPYYYDIPGLLRELSRLLFGIPIPPSKDLLFCSAFCQKVYKDVLGRRGWFSRPVKPEDTSDDEIWYPPLGARYPKHVPIASGRRRIVFVSRVTSPRASRETARRSRR